MKQLAIFFLLPFIACSENNFNHHSLQYDTSKIAFLPSKKQLHYLPEADTSMKTLRDSTAFPLTEDDFRTIETILSQSIQSYNEANSTAKANYVYIKLEDYKRQYVPYIDKKGHRRVWVNCFADQALHFFYDSTYDWKASLVSALDGGDWFFNSLIDLTTKQRLSFEMNSPG